MRDTILNRTAYSEYDMANRPARIVHLEGNIHLYTGEVGYDGYNNLQSFSEKVGPGQTAYGTTFAYDTENKPTQLTYLDGNRVTYTYDGIGRVSQKTFTVGSHAYGVAYSYAAGANGGNTTSLVAGLSQNGENFSYTYDDAGNIVSVSRNGVQTEYVYDALGQLIRVNDPWDPTNNSNGTTWTYEYDRGGNILNRKRYAFTTGPLGTVQAADVYAYADTDWKDKLTNYNGTAISYDAMGNPTNDGAWTYEWEHGRQLKQMSKSGTTAGFVYNKDGLRVQKTVNGVVTHYTLHGENIVHMTRGSNDLHFYYDAQKRLAEIVFNGTPYGVIHNLQGDVVGLFDSTGTEVVRYVYDAWGKPLSKTGSLAGTLGTLNPFRYRGYVFDEETGLYYLRSRYYCAEWCRFLNADTLVVGNIYSYCNNKVINNKDSSGYEFVRSIDELNQFCYQNGIVYNGCTIKVFLNNARTLTAPEAKKIPYVLGGCGLKGMDCAGLPVYLLGYDYKGSCGASTLFRRHAYVGGFISDIGWENVPEGAILGQLVSNNGNPYMKEFFEFSKIKKGGKYYIRHTGIMDHYDAEEEKTYMHQSSPVKKYKGVVMTAFSKAKMENLGWNVWMLPYELFDPDFLVRDTEEDD